MKARTKEEKFLIALYETISAAGDFDTEVDRYLVGRKISLHDRGIDTICKELAQTNFIKRHGPVMISITPNGKRLFDTLQSG